VIITASTYDGTPITEITAKEANGQPLTYYVPSSPTGSVALVTSDRYSSVGKGIILIGALQNAY